MRLHQNMHSYYYYFPPLIKTPPTKKKKTRKKAERCSDFIMRSFILFGQTDKLISFSGQTRPQLFVWLREEFHDYIQVLSDINLIWGGIITLNRGLSRFNQIRLRNTWNEQFSMHKNGAQSQRSLILRLFTLNPEYFWTTIKRPH